MVNLDQLDKKIIRHLSIGVSSYEDLARQCNVTRNTIYRRIISLEKQGIIKNTLKCTINLEHLNITPITIGTRIPQCNQDKAVEMLLCYPPVRWLLRTYGDHNLTIIAFCANGNEGQTINKIQSLLEKLGATHICLSVGFVWEKMNNQPYTETVDLETQINVPQHYKIEQVTDA